MHRKLFVFFIIFLVYLASTGISYALFSRLGGAITTTKPPAVADDGSLLFDDSLPKTEPCPLNGAKYSKQQREWWEKHRPLGIMVENHPDARPHSGLSSADVIYEAVAEGGITRFLVVYYCQNAGIVGPVRSARTYYLDYVSEYGEFPLYAHVGGANTPGPADALGQIADYGWNSYNDLSQFSLGKPVFFQIDKRNGRDVATEHITYSNTDELWKVAKDRKLTNVDEDGVKWDEDFVEYKFKDDAKAESRPVAQTVHVEHWEGYKDFLVDWQYDKATNTYKRIQAGAPHLDRNTNKQIQVKNVVLLFMQESSANDGYENNLHLLYDTKGTGEGQVFMDGKKTVVTWEKDGRTGRTILTNAAGEEIKFNRGLMWFHILPLEGVATVK